MRQRQLRESRAGAPLRTAVLGFGVSGRVFHAPFLAADSSYSLDFIATGNPERAALAARIYPDAVILDSPEDVFVQAGRLDLVVIGTPPSTHYELAAAAIEHGLNVVVDKPFVPTSREGEALIGLAETAGVALTVFQNRRWDADFLTLRKLLENGRLGDVHTFESRFEWWKPEGFGSWKGKATVAQGGGILYDLGSHLIDQALQLFGPVTEAAGQLARYSGGPSDADEDAFVTLVHANGTRSRLTMSGRAALPAPRFHVLGSAAAYTKWGLDGQEPALDAGALPTDAGFGEEPAEAWGVLGSVAGSAPVPAERGGYAEFYRRLAARLNEGAPLPVDPRSSVEVLRIIEHIHSLSN